MNRVVSNSPLTPIQRFLQLEYASGLLLVIAAVVAMVVVNSPLKWIYDMLLDVPVEVRIGTFSIAKPLLLWINDGLMAIFFFIIGLELKREILIGEMSELSKITLPVIAAVGGMAMPAAIYLLITWGDPVAIQGWAIPSATDIAFALGVLSLLGNRIPTSLKLFLLALAIADDFGAIIIIAIFYTQDLTMASLIIASVVIVLLFIINRRGCMRIAPYMLLGFVLWAAVLKSGVHATLAGVLLALFIPIRQREDGGESPLEELENDLHPIVAFAILPLFAFANSGISLQGMSFATLLEPVPLGVALGLFLGNQGGIMLLVWATVRLGIARLPDGVTWLQMYGVAILCGIGFTMSLFIGSLAFEQGATGHVIHDRLGILVGSIASAVIGYAVLRFASRGEASRSPI
ncbi:MAG: Na+/H+ antiporter NhaA [Mariprofundaceae bacterium]|nr:Na+/H+ antiporter NhaA [Mariprofundaceae bacterium]